jgi:hypothetical protein
VTIWLIIDIIAFIIIKTGNLMQSLDKKLHESSKTYQSKAGNIMELVVEEHRDAQPKEEKEKNF